MTEWFWNKDSFGFLQKTSLIKSNILPYKPWKSIEYLENKVSLTIKILVDEGVYGFVVVALSVCVGVDRWFIMGVIVRGILTDDCEDGDVLVILIYPTTITSQDTPNYITHNEPPSQTTKYTLSPQHTH